jgi:hypothetical protein
MNLSRNAYKRKDRGGDNFTQAVQAKGGSQSDFGSVRSRYGNRGDPKRRFVMDIGVARQGQGAIDRGHTTNAIMENAKKQGKFPPSWGGPEDHGILSDIGNVSSQRLREYAQRIGMKNLENYDDDAIREIVQQRLKPGGAQPTTIFPMGYQPLEGVDIPVMSQDQRERAAQNRDVTNAVRNLHTGVNAQMALMQAETKQLSADMSQSQREMVLAMGVIAKNAADSGLEGRQAQENLVHQFEKLLKGAKPEDIERFKRQLGGGGGGPSSRAGGWTAGGSEDIWRSNWDTSGTDGGGGTQDPDVPPGARGGAAAGPSKTPRGAGESVSMPPPEPSKQSWTDWMLGKKPTTPPGTTRRGAPTALTDVARSRSDSPPPRNITDTNQPPLSTPGFTHSGPTGSIPLTSNFAQSDADTVTTPPSGLPPSPEQVEVLMEALDTAINKVKEHSPSSGQLDVSEWEEAESGELDVSGSEEEDSEKEGKEEEKEEEEKEVEKETYRRIPSLGAKSMSKSVGSVRQKDQTDFEREFDGFWKDISGALKKGVNKAHLSVLSNTKLHTMERIDPVDNLQWGGAGGEIFTGFKPKGESRNDTIEGDGNVRRNIGNMSHFHQYFKIITGSGRTDPQTTWPLDKVEEDAATNAIHHQAGTYITLKEELEKASYQKTRRGSVVQKQKLQALRNKARLQLGVLSQMMNHAEKYQKVVYNNIHYHWENQIKKGKLPRIPIILMWNDIIEKKVNAAPKYTGKSRGLHSPASPAKYKRQTDDPGGMTKDVFPPSALAIKYKSQAQKGKKGKRDT